MANMGYCRFRNTLSDLEDCAKALDETDIADLSDEERAAALRLIVLCGEIADDNGSADWRDRWLYSTLTAKKHAPLEHKGKVRR